MAQEIIAYIIVGLAVAFAVRTFVRQFTVTDEACPKCGHCGSAQADAASKTEQLIQVEEPAEGRKH